MTKFCKILLTFSFFSIAYSQNAEIEFEVGQKLEEGGLRAQALVHFQNAFDLEKGNRTYFRAVISRTLVLGYSDKSYIGRATSFVDHIIRTLPTSTKVANYHLLLDAGMMFYISGQFIELKLSDSLTRRYGKVVYENMNLMSKYAINYFSEALRIIPEDSTLLLSSAYAGLAALSSSKEEGKYSTAIQYEKKAIALADSSDQNRMAFLYLQLGKYYANLERYEEAIASMDISTRYAPSDETSSMVRQYRIKQYVNSVLNMFPEWEPILHADGSPLISEDMLYLIYRGVMPQVKGQKKRFWTMQIMTPLDRDSSDIRDALINERHDQGLPTAGYGCYKYSKVLFEIDYSEQTVNTIKMVDYDSQGACLSDTDPNAKATPIVPGSIMEEVSRFCLKYSKIK